MSAIFRNRFEDVFRNADLPITVLKIHTEGKHVGINESGGGFYYIKI